MACHSTVGATTIKQEHTDRTCSSQQLVHQSGRHKEIKRELSPAPSPPTVQVCPINVVQGDSILVKLKYKEGQEYNYLIDGGHAKHLSHIINCMEEYGVMTRHGIQLDGIIVTHPDGDHLNGITKLLEKHRQMFLNSYDVAITEAFYWRSKEDVCTRFLKLMDKLYHKREISGAATCLRPGLNCYFPKESGCLLKCTARDDKVRSIQPSGTFAKVAPKHVDANETSILTAINQSERKCDAVLTGDSTAIEILPLVEGKEIGLFQVPHHGSYSNSRLKDKSKLVEYSGKYDLSIVHNNEVKEILLFYSTFKAQCYLISAGGTESYKHPHPHVLQGIILANSLRHHECVIVLTNSRGLNSEKLKQLHRLVPQWTQYVKIHHLDDVFFTEQYHTSLRPERCISDVRRNTVEWTPEGYINRAKIMLPVKPTIIDHRPLEKNRFTEQATIEITVQGTLKFNAHIICIPLPHSPRSGDSINCCYVIEESIASGVDLSKALFLLDNEERMRSLSRAKKYVLFQYVNNEWQKKQLPATVRDKSPQASPCQIPYDSINSLWPVQDSPVQISSTLSPKQRTNSLVSSRQPEQTISPHTPPSRIPHRSVTSAQQVQHASPPSHTPQQRVNSAQPIQNVSRHTPPSRIPHQSVTSTQQVQHVSPPSHTLQNSAQAIQDVSCQTPPNHTLHQSVVSVQPLQNISDPSQNIPYQDMNSNQPVQGSSPQISSYNALQLQHDISALQLGSEGAIAAASSEYAEPEVNHRVQSTQSEFISKGCRCKITDCTTNRCGCRKQGSYCGPNCQCSDCKNNEQYAFLLAQSQLRVSPYQPVLDSHSPQISPYDTNLQQLHQDVSLLHIGSVGATVATSSYTEPVAQAVQHRVPAIQQSMSPSPVQNYYGGYGSSTKGCRCKITDCTTNRCGCRKQGSYCGPNCQCSDCKNNEQYAFYLAQSQQRVSPYQPVLDSHSPQITPYDTDLQQLHQDVSLLHIGSVGATVTTNNYASNYTDPVAQALQYRVPATQQSMSPSPVQNHYGGYGSSTKGCRCKITECTTNRCGCRKQGSYCGSNCQCSDCKNNEQYAFYLAQSQQRVSTYQPVLGSQQRVSPYQSVHSQQRATPGQMTRVEVNVGSHSKGCGCKTGCATMRCGCKKQGLRCGPGCKCKNTYFNCQN